MFQKSDIKAIKKSKKYESMKIWDLEFTVLFWVLGIIYSKALLLGRYDKINKTKKIKKIKEMKSKKKIKNK